MKGNLESNGIAALVKSAIDTVNKTINNKGFAAYNQKGENTLEAKIYLPHVENIFYSTYYASVLKNTDNTIYKTLNQLDLFTEIHSFSELIN